MSEWLPYLFFKTPNYAYRTNKTKQKNDQKFSPPIIKYLQGSDRTIHVCLLSKQCGTQQNEILNFQLVVWLKFQHKQLK